jgi:hypothetical protein
MALGFFDRTGGQANSLSYICHADADKDIARAAIRYHDLESTFLGYSKAQSEVWLNELAEADVEESETRDPLQLALF